MKKRRILTSGLVLFILFNSSEVRAEGYNFANEQEKYEELCAVRSSYNNNKKACTAFEAYLEDKSKEAADRMVEIKASIETVKGDIKVLIATIEENNITIQQTAEQIKFMEGSIEKTKEDIKATEDLIIDRMVMMSIETPENSMIDFLMDSTDVNDLFVRLEVISLLTSDNITLMHHLDELSEDLQSKNQVLIEQKAFFEKVKEQNNDLLASLKAKETELYDQYEKENRSKSTFNEKLSNLNINDIVEVPPVPVNPPSAPNTIGFTRPVQHAWVTAISWYYPASFGGSWHPGIDLASIGGQYNVPIVAPANGYTLVSGDWGASGYGRHTVTIHQSGNDTYTIIYGHLNSVAGLSSFKQGDVIAYMGSTGMSTGPHVHVEVFKHANRDMKSVINEFKSNGDIWFGLGYNSTGSCSSVCRLAPQEFFNVSYGSQF